MVERSVAKYNYTYKEYLGESDTLSFNDIVQSDPYSIIPIKLKGIGHALYALKKTVWAISFNGAKLDDQEYQHNCKAWTQKSKQPDRKDIYDPHVAVVLTSVLFLQKTQNLYWLPVIVVVSTLQAGICSTSSSTTVSASKNVASTYSINSLECAAHVNDEVTLIVPKVLNKESISVSQIGAQYEIINNKFLSEQAEIAEKEPYQQEELTSGKSDAGADSYLAQIHVPKRVKHCGRPKGSTLTTIGLPKKRQRQLHEGLVPFLKLHPSKRHAMMLGWFLKPDDVQKALSGILIQSSCIEKRVNCISSAILDESAQGSLLSLQSYFTADGWKVLNEIIDVKCQQRIWLCALCQKSTSVGNDIGGSIACDSCLLWFHKKCVGKKEGWFIKSKNWFCRFCSTV
ncbi:uncharacterized protein LOC136096484 [Hydra vulgaris]|uniref:uncharacterized protein LOC136096484 n=1 Tax=Hydra vulgaris TaxID=6087 RepID=UPI0032EA49A3